MGDSFTITVDPSGLRVFQQAAAALAGPKLQQALREALSAAGGKARTQVRRALREQTNVKAASDVNVRTRSFMNGSALEYKIEGINKALPIDRVKGLEVQTGQGGGVSAAPWNAPRQFQRSFVLDGKYVARTGPDRFPLRRLWGPSIMKELVKGESKDTFERYATAELEAQVTRKLERLLAP